MILALFVLFLAPLVLGSVIVGFILLYSLFVEVATWGGVTEQKKAHSIGVTVERYRQLESIAKAQIAKERAEEARNRSRR